MPGIDIAPWEPEESVGRLWHALSNRLGAEPGPGHEGAAIELAGIAGRLATLFRGLGGDPSIEIKGIVPETARHRLGFFRKLAAAPEKSPCASIDGEALRLPASLAVFPWRDANLALYVWLAACAAHAESFVQPDDPMLADLAALAAGEAMVARNCWISAWAAAMLRWVAVSAAIRVCSSSLRKAWTAACNCAISWWA